MTEQPDNNKMANEEEPLIASPLTIYTIGHSTHPIEEFIGILQTYAIRQLVDVRSIPRSRTNPQFNKDVIGQSLADVNILYHHLDALGGLRHSRKDSPNMGWRNASFRGYADYMLTPAFHTGLEQLISLASTQSTAIMCAEAVPWRCHRSLIADALTIRNVQVYDIFSRTQAKPHKLNPMAQLRDGQLYYEEEVHS